MVQRFTSRNSSNILTGRIDENLFFANAKKVFEEKTTKLGGFHKNNGREDI